MYLFVLLAISYIMCKKGILVYAYYGEHSVKLIEAEWRIYASVNKVIIGPDNGLPPDRQQVFIWNNA